MNCPKETTQCSDPKKEILEIVFNVNQKINVNSLKRQYWEDKNKVHLWDYLMNKISIYPQEWKWSEKIYCFIHDLKERPTCSVCRNKVKKFYTFEKGYADTCSRYCATQSEERRNKIKSTYGSWTEEQRQEHTDKIREGFQDKFGVDNVSQTDYFKEVYKKRMTEKYGVENYFKMREVVKEHWLEKINTDNPSKNKEIKDKANATVREKYGELHGAVPKKQYLETMRERYGTDHFFSSEQGRMTFENLKKNYGWTDKELVNLAKQRSTPYGKASKSSAKVFIPLYDWCVDNGVDPSDIYVGIGESQEFTIYDTRNFRGYMYDFTIKSQKLIIEYHGTKFHPKSIDENWEQLFSQRSAKEIFLEDCKKKEFAENNGYRVLILWSDESDSANLEKSKKFISEGR